MSLVYFEGRDGNTIAIVASTIVAITRNRTPTETPVRVSCINGQFDVRGGFDDAEHKLLCALEKDK